MSNVDLFNVNKATLLQKKNSNDMENGPHNNEYMHQRQYRYR